MRLRPVLSLLVVLLAVAVSTASALVIERDVRFDPARLRLSSANGFVALEAKGGTHEYAAGASSISARIAPRARSIAPASRSCASAKRKTTDAASVHSLRMTAPMTATTLST